MLASSLASKFTHLTCLHACVAVTSCWETLLCALGVATAYMHSASRGLNALDVCAAFVTLHWRMSCMCSEYASIGFMPFLCHAALMWYVRLAH